jgi:hypothetical protein
MGCYVVLRHLPGITPEALTGAGLRAKSCAAEMTEEGKPIHSYGVFLFQKQNKPTAILRLQALMR